MARAIAARGETRQQARKPQDMSLAEVMADDDVMSDPTDAEELLGSRRGDLEGGDDALDCRGWCVSPTDQAAGARY